MSTQKQTEITRLLIETLERHLADHGLLDPIRSEIQALAKRVSTIEMKTDFEALQNTLEALKAEMTDLCNRTSTQVLALHQSQQEVAAQDRNLWTQVKELALDLTNLSEEMRNVETRLGRIEFFISGLQS